MVYYGQIRPEWESSKNKFKLAMELLVFFIFIYTVHTFDRVANKDQGVETH